MFCTPSRTVVAKKQHVCTNCAQKIEIGETYMKWKSVDVHWFTNRMHPECLRSLQEDADGYGFEYMPYSGERPVYD